ncbi:MAG: hypothetical protein IIX48_12335, partial [Lachnospiraceae bacterium]|nr:hypothetical protein [Lachnospiraceae bacterium]
IGALFLAIPRTSLGISVYEREVVRYSHVVTPVLPLQKMAFSAIILLKNYGTSFVVSFYQESVKGSLSVD